MKKVIALTMVVLMLILAGAFLFGCGSETEGENEHTQITDPRELIIGEWHRKTTMENVNTVVIYWQLSFNSDGTWHSKDTTTVLGAAEDINFVLESEGTWSIDEDYTLTRVKNIEDGVSNPLSYTWQGNRNTVNIRYYQTWFVDESRLHFGFSQRFSREGYENEDDTPLIAAQVSDVMGLWVCICCHGTELSVDLQEAGVAFATEYDESGPGTWEIYDGIITLTVFDDFLNEYNQTTFIVTQNELILTIFGTIAYRLHRAE